MTADQVYRILKDIGTLEDKALLSAHLASGDTVKLSAVETILGETVEESVLKGFTEASHISYIPVSEITRIDLI
jgi:hypothetical protein